MADGADVASTSATTGERSSIIRLPHTLVYAFPGNQFLLVTSPVSTRVISLPAGALALKLQHDNHHSAPRVAAAIGFQPQSSSASHASAGFLLAVVSDDKTLSVHRLDTDGSSSDLLKHECIFSHVLPKRVVKLAWEDGEDAALKRLVIGDRHGDVRSLVVSIDQQIASTSRQIGTSADSNQAKGTIETTETAKSKLEDDEEDEVGTLHVGHVSLLTDFVLSSFSSDERRKPDQYIITSDRDEHIRISRWGKRRAGYIALRYLLGSTEAVGALCTVERGDLARLRSSLQASSVKTRQDWTTNPILVSTDGTRLRLWDLYPDNSTEARRDLLAVFDLEKVIAQYARIDMWRERRRERLFGKGKIDMKRTIANIASLDDAQGRSKTLLPIITKLRLLNTASGQHLLFSIDGGSALFTLPLVALFETGTDVADKVVRLDVGLPIIDYTLCHDQTGTLCVWLACDIREDLAGEGAAERPSLQLAQWNDESGAFVLAGEAAQAVVSVAAEEQADLTLAASILVYDALTLYPKQDFEATATLESSSADGLIKGGLANHEIPGRPASKANHANSEHVTRRREKAREAMMKRIEERVEEPSNPRRKKQRQRRKKGPKTEDGVQGDNDGSKGAVMTENMPTA